VTTATRSRRNSMSENAIESISKPALDFSRSRN